MTGRYSTAWQFYGGDIPEAVTKPLATKFEMTSRCCGFAVSLLALFFGSELLKSFFLKLLVSTKNRPTFHMMMFFIRIMDSGRKKDDMANEFFKQGRKDPGAKDFPLNFYGKGAQSCRRIMLKL